MKKISGYQTELKDVALKIVLNLNVDASTRDK
jgi:hypothetical protein